MTTKKILSLLCFILLAPLPALAQNAVDPLFNPNKIIEDSELLDYNAMSLPDIQNFLQSKNSYLANYITPNASGVSKSAAEIIYDASHNNFDCSGVTLSDAPTELEKQQKCRIITTVNPKFLLILLQKEAGLIEDPSPAQARLDWATGYGCPDGWVCNPYYKGFGKQVNSASLQFLAYINEQERYNYKAGQTYTIANTLDPYCTTTNQTMVVTPVNKATAALYNYTPHVFNGNYNVYLLWNRYFPRSAKLYPDGSILQVKGDPGIWLIQNGLKRPFLNYSAFISRYQPNQVVAINANELDGYAPGDAIKFANYSLVQTPDKKIYLLVDKQKREFASLAVFKKIGFNSEEIEQASVNDLATYAVGNPITATSTYVTGVLMQDTKTGGVFYVVDGTKAPLTDRILLTTKFKDKKITKATTATLAAYTKVAPVVFADGTLLKTDGFPTVYLISNGLKRPFANEAIFNELGYNAKNIISVSSQFLYNYSQGEIIQKIVE
ncbi:MAG: hypothetical protein WC467_00890 [Patescibacteria group bacterium]